MPRMLCTQSLGLRPPVGFCKSVGRELLSVTRVQQALISPGLPNQMDSSMGRAIDFEDL